MVMIYEDGNTFKGGAGYFLTQKDGHNCGPIACLKFMEMYDFIDMDIIEKNHGKNGSSWKSMTSLIWTSLRKIAEKIWQFVPSACLRTASYVFGLFEG